MIRNTVFCASLLAAALVWTSPAQALDAKRTVMVLGGPSDPVAIRARAELEGAGYAVVSPEAPVDTTRTEVETLARALTASAALSVHRDVIEVWIADDTTHRALLVDRVENTELGALRGVEIVRATFGEPRAAPTSTPAPTLTPDRVASASGAPADGEPSSPWNVGARVGGSVVLMDFPGYGNSVVVPVQIEVGRRVGPVQLGAYGAFAAGRSIMSDSSRGVEEWHLGAFIEHRFGSRPQGWFAVNAGYTAVEVHEARTGFDLGLAGGLDFAIGKHMSLGPYLSASTGVVDGGNNSGQGRAFIPQPSVWMGWAALGARASFDGF